MGERKQKVSPEPSSLTTSPSPDLADRERRPELSPTDLRPISEPVSITNQRRPYRIADITATGVVRLGYFAIHAAL